MHAQLLSQHHLPQSNRAVLASTDIATVLARHGTEKLSRVNTVSDMASGFILFWHSFWQSSYSSNTINTKVVNR